MAHTTVKDVLGALGEVTFPADKETLVRSAQAAGAPEDVVRALRAIPPEEYGNRDEVVRSVRLEPDSDLGRTESQRAEQARLGGKPGLSQHLRDVPEPPVEEERRR